MDYGSDDPKGIEQQVYLQDLIRNNPNIARFIALAQGQYDGIGATPVDAAQNRYSANMRQAFPVEYYASRIGANVVGNQQALGRTLANMSGIDPTIRNRLWDK